LCYYDLPYHLVTIIVLCKVLVRAAEVSRRDDGADAAGTSLVDVQMTPGSAVG
jgi:hypothetical protein